MTKPWRECSALYQIYPRSFQDSNADGVGDLRGIIQRLDYLKELGVDGFWLSPVYASPQLDCGYDISDYYAIDLIFGTMADMERLIEEAHARELKVIMDFVPNHTSDQHEWFRQASSSRDNPYRNYYVWRDAQPDGSPPTNWISLAGGSSWQWHEPTGQYYLHSFMPEQPDLNWDNPAVREAMHNVLRFWLDKGVDGFRVDAEWPISKVYEDDPVNPDYHAETAEWGEYGAFLHTNCKNGPHLHDYMREMTEVAAAYDERFMIFEYYTEEEFGDPVGEYVDIFALNTPVAAPFVFDLFRLEWHAERRAARARELYERIPQSSLPIYCLGNHDQTRISTRYGAKQARALAVVQMCLPGLPTIYYGDEIGMTDFAVATEQAQDNFKENSGMGGRDPERAPMQWDATAGGGFTGGTPWLPLNSNRTEVNVQDELMHESSTLRLYKQLLVLRRDPVLLAGSYQPVDVHCGYVWAFARETEGKKLYCLINFTDREQAVTMPVPSDVVISSDANREHWSVGPEFALLPYEAVIVRG